MMRRFHKQILSLITGFVLFTASQSAFSAIDAFANIFIRTADIRGECLFGIDDTHPFSAINSNCETINQSTSSNPQLAVVPISGFLIGFPRTGYQEYQWETLYTGAIDTDAFYCQIFGITILNDPGSTIELGHYSDPDENDEIEGAMRCKTPIKPISWTNNYFVYCHLPVCALWDMGAIGGAGASAFDIRRSFSLNGAYTTIQTESSINYFNVHGNDQNLYWKVCGTGLPGETCSDAYRTRVECEIGGGGGPLY